jgi:hypothetical protein
MNPEQIAKSGTEHAEQSALFCWANKAQVYGFAIADDMTQYSSAAGMLLQAKHFERPHVIPELKWLHAIPNAGARGNRVAASQLKAEGVKAGVSDICWPLMSLYGSGLYLEMKRLNGKLSDFSREQIEFRDFITSQNFKWVGCFGWFDASRNIIDYHRNRSHRITAK